MDASVTNEIDGTLRDNYFRKPSLAIGAALDQIVIKKEPSGSLFSIARNAGLRNGAMYLDNVPVGEVVHLHWTEGMMSRSSISRFLERGGRLVCTLHDMAPFTGGCHFSMGCRNFESNCQDCPLVKSVFRPLVAHQFQQKMLAFSANPGTLKLAAPSSWIKDQASNSAIFSDVEIEFIPNPISKVFFQRPISPFTRGDLGLKSEDFVLAVVAESLSDPIKGVGFLIERLKSVISRSLLPITLLLIGNNGSKFANAAPFVKCLGPMSPETLAAVYPNVDLVINASSAESAGMTIKEAAACGVPALIFGSPGAASTVVADWNGFVVMSDDEFIVKILSLLENPEQLRAVSARARADARLNHAPEVAARRYAELYEP